MLFLIGAAISVDMVVIAAVGFFQLSILLIIIIK